MQRPLKAASVSSTKNLRLIQRVGVNGDLSIVLFPGHTPDQPGRLPGESCAPVFMQFFNPRPAQLKPFAFPTTGIALAQKPKVMGMASGRPEAFSQCSRAPGVWSGGVGLNVARPVLPKAWMVTPDFRASSTTLQETNKIGYAHQ